MGRLVVFSYTSSHLFLRCGSSFALSYSLTLLKPELRFLTPCPTCVHIIFVQQDLLSCVCVRVCEVWPYTVYGAGKNDFWSPSHRHGLSILSTQLLSLKPKSERSFTRTEENTKQQLDEIFKWCHKWLTIHIQSRKANKFIINQLSLTLTSRFC